MTPNTDTCPACGSPGGIPCSTCGSPGRLVALLYAAERELENWPKALDAAWKRAETAEAEVKRLRQALDDATP